MLSTNSSCQLSEAPQNISQGVLGLPLPTTLPNSSTYHMVKARKTQVTNSKRKALMSAEKAECNNQAIVKTEDLSISAEDYQTMQDGGFVTVKGDTDSKIGCTEASYQCTGEGPNACGYTGWTNPANGKTISFHQVFIVSFINHSNDFRSALAASVSPAN